MAAPTNTSDRTHPVAWRYEPLLLLAVALGLGIFLDRTYPQSLTAWWSFTAFAVLSWLIIQRFQFEAASGLVVLSGVISLGGAWHHYRWHVLPDDHIVASIREESQPICLNAYVLSSPRIVPAPPPTPLRTIPQGDRSRCEVLIQKVREGAHWRKASGRARLTVEGHVLHVGAGDVIRVHAIYQRPTPALNRGEFDFALFERSQRRWCSLSADTPECLSVVQPGRWWDLRRQLDQLRLRGDFQLRRHLSPTRAALASAVMLGEREYLDADRNERFLVTGTVHLLAISGLNLAILVYVFWVLGRTGMLSRRATLLSAILFAVSYALLTDSEAPVLRAAVLITAFCFARWSGRPASSWNILGGAAAVVLGTNPASLFHVGAQLSFLAVAVLVWFQPLLSIRSPEDPLDRLILESRPWPFRAVRFGLLLTWQVVLSGTVIWLISFPLVWRYYNLISPVGLVLNPLVWPPMTVALFSGFAVLVLSWIVPPLGAVSGRICDGSLWLLEYTIEKLEPLRHGYHWLPAPPWWWIATFYAVVLIVLLFPAIRPSRRWGLVLITAWTVLAFYLAMPVHSSTEEPERPLDVTFVSVGHGAAILVELPDGRRLLYDCGRLGSPLSGARPIAAVLWSRGITHLDAVVISHADSDHYNALPELLERFSVGVVYVSTVMWNGPGAGPQKLRQSIRDWKVPIETLRSNDQLRIGGEDITRMEVLHPPRGGVFGSDNANSIVLLMEHAGRRVLLTGDLEARGLADLMAEPAIDCDLLMAPHHGSTRSNPQGLAAWCRPEHVVISGARDYELGRDEETVARAFFAAGASVYHTAEHGAIRFELTRDAVRATTHRLPPENREESVYFVATKAR